MKQIPLYYKGEIVDYAKIDDEDYVYLSQFKWHLDSHGYAVRRKKGQNGWIKMHREILDFPKNQCDHINHIRIDNTKENLREVTNAQNMQNSTGWSNATSKYRGVSFDKTRNKWRATVMVNGKQVFSKRFNTEQEAILAVKQARMTYMPYAVE